MSVAGVTVVVFVMTVVTAAISVALEFTIFVIFGVAVIVALVHSVIVLVNIITFGLF